MSPAREPNEPREPLLTADFDYDLPSELIAQTPTDRRDASRLLVLDKSTGAIEHASVADLPEFLAPGDLLVANNSRVIPARLRGVRLPHRGAVEVLLLRREAAVWRALGRPAKRLRPGTVLEFPARDVSMAPARAAVTANLGEGMISLQFEENADEFLDRYGVTPLPPYIVETLTDSERYQTIYGTAPGSAAAPTAGLHFTEALLTRLRARGIGWSEVTLHVGLDTFRPVNEPRIADHQIHQEWCEVSQETATHIARCRLGGGRIVAVGTTAARTLETLGRSWDDHRPHGFSGLTDEFILPGHRWRLVDALLTNFHLPKSTLLMLVSALAGREAILKAYGEAKERRYRFYSFGDAMLIR